MQRNTVSRVAIMKRGLRIQCPNCGSGGLFRGLLRIRYRCPGCGLKLSRSDGFFLGAMVWNYGLTVFGVLAPLVLLGALGMLSLEVVVAGCFLAGLLVPILCYRLAWSLWLMCYYWALPHELPSNAGDNPAVDEDE